MMNMFQCFHFLDEVECVCAKEASEEQKRKAQEPKSPLNFLFYETASACQESRSCDRDEEPASIKNDFNSPLAGSPPSELSFSLVTAGSSGFKRTARFSLSGTGQQIFGGVSFFKSMVNFQLSTFSDWLQHLQHRKMKKMRMMRLQRAMILLLKRIFHCQLWSR